MLPRTFPEPAFQWVITYSLKGMFLSLGDRAEKLVPAFWKVQREVTRILPSHTIHRISCVTCTHPANLNLRLLSFPAVTGTLSSWTRLCSTSKVLLDAGLPSALQSPVCQELLPGLLSPWCPQSADTASHRDKLVFRVFWKWAIYFCNLTLLS